MSIKLDVDATHANPLQCADRICIAKLLEIVLLPIEFFFTIIR